MKYALRKWVNWGPDHEIDYPPGWTYLVCVGKWDSTWNLKLSKAKMFNDWDSAAAFRLEHCHVLGEHNSEHVEIAGFTDKELFKLKLKGE